MIFNIVGLLIGLMILGAGIYYFIKEKGDKDSRKIYSVIAGIGAVIVGFVIIRMMM